MGPKFWFAGPELLSSQPSISSDAPMRPAKSPPETVAMAPTMERTTGRWKLIAMAQRWPPPMDSPKQPKMSSVFMRLKCNGVSRVVSKGLQSLSRTLVLRINGYAELERWRS